MNIILIRHSLKQRDLTTHVYFKIKVNRFVVFLCIFLSHWRTG